MIARLSRPARIAAAALAAASLGLTACGTGASTGSSTATAGSCPGLAEARSVVAQYSANPVGVGYDLPLTKPIPAAQRIAAIETPVPIAKATNDNRAVAAELLGWSVDRVVADGTPEGPAKAMTQALAQNPNALFYSGYDPATVREPLQQALNREVPVVVESVPNNTDPAIVGTVRDEQSNDVIGKLTAAFLVSDSNCTANVEAWTVPSQPILTTYQASLEKWLGQWCPECRMTVNDYEFSDIGTNVPGMVVSALQTNPDATYVIFGYGESTLGVDAALRTAGLADQVKVGGAIPGPDQFEGLRTGRDAFWATDSGPALAWKETDLMIRAMTGDDLAGAQQAPIPAQLLTPETVGGAVFDANGYWIGYPGIDEAYRAMWRIG
ncbi:sugar ABC transporter substrate-binding protein [Pseudonocardia sp. RS010]|uniref:sugar ABC transporter substrate-binding protein n=1 Tax=Pseudonocardia sp. RS010 TaxID=3385979 RepID=UPI0039A1F209